MATDIQRLAQIIDKLNTLALQVGMIGEVEDTLVLADEWMTELQQAAKPLEHIDLDDKLETIVRGKGRQVGALGSVISVLQEFPLLYAIAYWLDRAGAVVIFLDPHHTISYNIAIRAQAGEQWAIDCCQALNLLSPDHCQWALKNEGLLRLP